VSSSRILLFILLLAAWVRIAWVMRLPTDAGAVDALPDQREYLEIGRNFSAGQGMQFFDRRFGEQVWAYRTPGYPLLVAACGGRILVIRIVQAILDSSTVLAVYLIARVWLTPRVGLLAAAIVAVDPLLIFFSGLILSETLFVALLVWGLAICLRARPCAAKAFGGVLLACSVMVRPSAILLPVIAAVVGVGGIRGRLTNAAGVLGLTLLVLFPWAVRNEHRLGAWIWTTTNVGITQYDGFNPQATGASDQAFVRQMPELRGMGEVERSRYLASLADQFVADHPAAVVKLTILKIARMWSPMPLSQQYGSRPMYMLAGLIFTLPLIVLAVLGLFRSDLPRWAKSWLLMPAIYFTVIHAASVSSLRYRLPAEPGLAILAAAGIGGKGSALKITKLESKV
jgi:4-amino-4-deoxy-L-arabinose transferase-like glycosyltransferase